MSSPSRAEIETTLASLASSGAFPELARPDGAALAWVASPLRLIWASPAAESLAAALVVDGAGAVASSLPASERLSALAGGLAPRDRARLEKLRFETSAFAPLSTCACRLVSLPDGTPALVTIFVDRLPRLSVRPRPAALAGAASEQIPADPVAPQPAVPEPAAPEPSGLETPQAQAAGPAPGDAPENPPEQPPEPEIPETIRFVWEADAEGRIARITSGLAEAVGPGSADVVGRRFADLIGERVHDPKDIVAELIARGETFSGRTLHWRVGTGEEAVPVDLAGLPVRDRERGLVGYRGFGLCRPRNRLHWIAPAPVAEPPPLETAPAAEPFAEPPALTPAAPETSGPEVMEPPVEAQAAEDPVIEEPVVQEPVAPEPIAEARISEPLIVEAQVVEAQVVEAQVVGDEAGAEEVVGEQVFREQVFRKQVFGEQIAQPQAEQNSGAGERRDDAKPMRRFGSLAGRVDAAFGSAPAATDAPGSTTAQAVEARAVAEVRPDSPSERPALSETERSAFREIARALGAAPPGDPEGRDIREDGGPDIAEEFAPEESVAQEPAIEGPVDDDGLASVMLSPANDLAPDSRAVLDRLPAGVVVNRGERAIFVNRYLLDLLGYEDLDAFQREGGLARLFRGRPGALEGAVGDSTAPLSVATREGGALAVEVRLTTVDWCGAPASMLMLRKVGEADPAERLRAMELDLLAREESLREQAAILDTATDGVALLDQNGRILSLNRSAEALFGFDQREVTGEPFTLLLQTESHVAALGYLDAMRGEGLGALLNDGREVLGRERQGGAIPLFMTLGLIGDGPERKFCVVLRDMTAFKQAESELVASRRAAERSNAQKSDFLAKISHEIRTPLNAIIGFAEVMLEERFGPVGNERYRDYVADIHASGAHVISLVNDLLDLAKIEAGRMELTFGPVALNEIVGSCVALMQPQAARDRIVLRTSFGENVPPVEADERALRQIVLNLLSNAVKFTDAGGQVIVSTAVSGSGDVVFRVRDTGIGMNEADIETALEPFRQLATSRRGGGTGLGLPLTKALVEANRGTLKISSRRGEGTLVEVALRPVPATAS